MSIEERVKLSRLPTGIPGLDAILSGGLLRGGLYILMGTPGAGKTILGNQICFNHVGRGQQATYVTLLAETHTKMLAHMEKLAFFSLNPIADTLRYVSGYRILEEEGLDGFLAFLRRTITQQNPSLLVIDGTATLEAMDASDLVLKRFYHELQAYSEVTRCTIILLTHAAYQQRGRPEHTMVDGIIELRDQSIGLRAVRELEVRKMRGSGVLRGTHFFTISDAGITVFPRTEALLASPDQRDDEPPGSLQLGDPALDQMLGGGLLRGSATLVSGPPGSGKTVLGLQFLAAGAEQTERCLFFGFYERPTRLIRKAAGIGLPLERYVEDRTISLIWQSSTEYLIDVLAHRLLASIHEQKVSRLFIDGIDGFKSSAAYPERLTRFTTALMNELRGLNVTTLVSSEALRYTDATIEEPIIGLSVLMDNVVHLRSFERHSQLHRLISIVKMRDQPYDTASREFVITSGGIRVAQTFESAERLLADAAQQPPAGGVRPVQSSGPPSKEDGDSR